MNSGHSPDDLRHIVQNMSAAIAHRGPDASDIWRHPSENIIFAHQRLAIIDLSDDGRQPMASPSGRYVITYNGEIYNYLILKKELEAAGGVFKSRSDTEVILVALEQWGIAQTLQKINGMFAFCIFDEKEKKLYFVRDRFGKKPLYVGWCGDDLVFSSELKSFHTHPHFNKQINNRALESFMRYGCVHAPYSIFEGVWQMLPASLMEIDLRGVKAGESLSEKMEVFWRLKDKVSAAKAHPLQKSEAEIILEFEGVLEEAVSQRQISDVPLGAFLSGGIDSSLIVALMQKQSSVAVQSFSIGFDEAAYDEAPYAKKIAAHLGTDHQEFYVSASDAQDIIPHLPDIYDEPFADSSQIPTALLCRHVRQKVTVALTGDGGDEILAGYERHIKIASLWKMVGWMPRPLRQALGGVIRALPDSALRALKGNDPLFPLKIKRAMGLMRLSGADEIYEALLSFWAHSPLLAPQDISDIPLKNKKYWPQDLSFREQMIFGDLLSYRPNDLMVKADRASMASALELRAPLMDYRLAEYSVGLADNMKVRKGQGKYLLRQILKKHVPESLFERPKMGFSIPMAAWLRGDLKSWGDDLLALDTLKAQGIVNAEMVHGRWVEFQQSESQQTPKDLWAALMFQSWHQRWIKE